MLNYQKFLIKDFKNVVFLGYSKSFSEMKQINSNLNIKTYIITSPDQKKSFISTDGVHVFKKIDKKFNDFIKQKINVN